MAIAQMLRRRAPTDPERADHAEVQAFHAGVNRIGLPRNRKSQVLLTVALIATFLGAALSLVGSYVGFGLFVVGLPTLVATSIWCVRNWDY